MSYFYSNGSYSSFVGIYPYNSHHSKAQKAQNHRSSLWPILNSKEIKPIDKLQFSSLLSQNFHKDIFSTR